jgi:nitrogen fixation protein FixH
MKRSLWRFFPLAVVAGLGLVVLINAGLVYAALHSFPGKAGDEDFALSNRYDAVLEREQHEALLGWNLLAQTDAAGTPEIRLIDRGGSPLRGASVAASAERPLGAPERRTLVFREIATGRYVADAPLPITGQWELTVSASLGGHDIAATRRVIVR